MKFRVLKTTQNNGYACYQPQIRRFMVWFGLRQAQSGNYVYRVSAYYATRCEYEHHAWDIIKQFIAQENSKKERDEAERIVKREYLYGGKK